MGINVETILFKLDANPYFSPEFGRGGMRAICSARATHVAGSGTLTITVQHKNSDDTAFADLAAFSVFSATGTDQLEITGMKEILRFKFEVGGPGATSAVAFMMTAPQWFPN